MLVHALLVPLVKYSIHHQKKKIQQIYALRVSVMVLQRGRQAKEKEIGWDQQKVEAKNGQDNRRTLARTE